MNPTYNTCRSLREAFLGYFENLGHRRIRSAPLIPGDDPTLLFTNAGMVQFKDLFTGQRSADYQRATSSQKCLRVSGKHNDLDVVGRTPRHHTFFEMLGNFSFGDYFKETAIEFAWTFLTDPTFCGLPVEKLWVSVHDSDDEAYALWHEKVGVPEARILRLGDADNFWSMGDTGPCGPCTEIHWDRGPEYGEDPEDRLLEIWNLVFMQFERHPDGSKEALPAPSVDTGMGLERLASILQGKESNYDTDLFREVIAAGEAVSGQAYGASEEGDLALRVIADHARASAFLIADGILPGNEGRSYVLRRIMRRAIRYGSGLGLTETFFHRVCGAVVAAMGEDHPELIEASDIIERAVPLEEELFHRTLHRGLHLIERWCEEQEPGTTMPGSVAFRLYDTYGFPRDLTRQIGEERGFDLDSEGFDAAMELQRETARASRKAKQGGDALSAWLVDEAPTPFVGETELRVPSLAVRSLLSDAGPVDTLQTGETGIVILPRSPFYPESGGQVGDRGTLYGGDVEVEVLDTQRNAGGVCLHRVRVREGTLARDQLVDAVVDDAGRTATARNHSGTHLLHYALREVLGPHARQRGSLVEPGRLRFDFSHYEAVGPDDLRRIEEIANAMVLENAATEVASMSYDDAIASGALAFFGDKYGDDVRTVQIGTHSYELCGGTHVARSGDIGLVQIVTEGSVSSGVRRIEALTGAHAFSRLQQREQWLQSTADRLHASPADTLDRVDALLRQQKELQKEVEELKRKLAAGSMDGLLKEVEEIAGVSALAVQVENVDKGSIRELGDRLRDRLKSGALLLATAQSGKVTLLCMVSKDLTDRLKAGDLVAVAAEAVGGRGGGRPDMAQAGGSDVSGIPQALARFKERIREQLG